jgi:hypothetical protein
MNRITGSDVLPVSAVAVMGPPTPTFTVATAKAFAPRLPGRLTMPPPTDVADKATISGTRVFDADRYGNA